MSAGVPKNPDDELDEFRASIAGASGPTGTRARSFAQETLKPIRYNGWVVRLWEHSTPRIVEAYAFITRDEAVRFASGFDSYSIRPGIVKLVADNDWNKEVDR